MTCMISGIKKDSGKNLKQKCTNLLKDGLGLPEIEIVNVARVGDCDDRPGIIKLQTKTINDKIKILRYKGKLRDNTYCRVYIRSSKSHEQRLLEQHTMELLTMQGKANDYTFN